jgi:hypothetical protein
MGGSIQDAYGITQANAEKARALKAQNLADQRALAAMAPPDVSDQAIRDAILAERNRMLAGSSRTAAFAPLPGQSGYRAPVQAQASSGRKGWFR